MQQKDLIDSLHSHVMKIESGLIPEQSVFDPEIVKDTEIDVKAVYASVVKYKIPSEVLSTLRTLAKQLGSEDQSIINVLCDPNPFNVNALIAAAQKADENYIEKNGSLANLFKEGALTCAYAAGFLLLCLTAPLVFPLTVFVNCFCVTNCFESNSVPMKYCQFFMDTFLAINESIDNTENAYDELTYDCNTNVANYLIGFFKPKQAEPEPVPGLNLLNFQGADPRII